MDKEARPQFTTSFVTSQEEFDSYREVMQESDYPMKVVSNKIIASIQSLYISLNKRSIITQLPKSSRYRVDGFEAMFFSDLTQWLAVDLPRYSITEKSTADLVMKRILFCEQVEEHVFVFRDDAKKRNPKTQLRRVIGNLRTIHSDLLKSIEAATFNNYIDSMSRDLQDMIVSAFDILHLANSKANRIEMQVDELLAPIKKVDEKIEILLNTVMGQWVKSTLETAKIKSNNFNSTEEILLRGIDQHLVFDFSQFKRDSVGFRDFVETVGANKSEKRKYARTILEDTTMIHQAILNACFVRFNLVLASRVGIRDGENWLYKSKGGKAIVETLLAVIDDARGRLLKVINVFWKDYYTNGYEPYAEAKDKDINCPTHIFLLEAKRRVELLNKRSEHLHNTIETVTALAKQYDGDSETAKQQKRTLASNLCAYVQLREGVASEDHISSLKEVVEGDVQITEVIVQQQVTFKSEIIEPHIVRFPIAKLPRYQLAKKLLLEKEPSSKELTLMKHPGRFYTETQERLYEKFLKAYHNTVNAHPLLSFLYGVSWGNISPLCEFYAKANDIMKEIYKPRTIAGYSLSLMSPELNIEEKKLYITIKNESIEYVVKGVGEDKYTGSISMSEIDAQWKAPITFEILQTYFLKILDVTSKRGHTFIPAEVAYEDDNEEVFYRLRKKGVETPEFLWKTELDLIDQIFKAKFLTFSQERNASIFNVLTSEKDLLSHQVEEKGEDIMITIDESKLTYAGGAFAIALERSEQKAKSMEAEAASSKEKHQEALDEIALLKNKIATKDTELATKDTELATARDESVEMAAINRAKLLAMEVANQRIQDLQAERQPEVTPDATDTPSLTV